MSAIPNISKVLGLGVAVNAKNDRWAVSDAVSLSVQEHWQQGLHYQNLLLPLSG
ncbi:MAG: hypothetical protein HQK70_12535 [Desulfamplus sp.]|nr:hypothetical protein [Desulfamplus sp.]